MDVKEKLVELIQNAVGGCTRHWAEVIADNLIANGVLIAPCKFGDDIWWINEDTKTVECERCGVTGVAFTKDNVLVRDTEGYYDKPGTTYCFLTKEDAEAELARRANND